jgi:PAS domain S-box-containing protein
VNDAFNKTGLATTMIDRLQNHIHELESSRAELEEIRQRLAAETTFSESVISSLPGLFFMVDEEGRYHRWNRNLEKLLGYTAEEINLRDCRDFVPLEDKTRIIDALRTGFKEGTFTVEYDNLTRDGTKIPFFARGVSVEIHGKRFIIGVELNLSELKRTEQALSESEEQLRALVDTATNFAVYRLSFEEGDPQKARVVFVSPSIADILGITRTTQMDGWFDTIHPEDADQVKADHAKLPRPQRIEQTLRIFHRGLGQWRWIRFLSTTDYDHRGRLSHSNGIVFDITDQVRDREELVRKEEELKRQTDKLARLNTALQVLVEHREQEMRDAQMNVLTALERLVKPYLQNLASSGLDEEQRTNLEIALTNLQTISTPLTRKLTSWQGLLSGTEIRVADLIRHGKGTKEIADLLGISINTVLFHRKNIRRKLDLVNRKVNLIAYLASLDVEK